MGATISAIEQWIAAGYSLPSALKSLWESVASLFRKACDVFQNLVRSVRGYIFYERENRWSDGKQEGRSLLRANLGVNADQDQREPGNRPSKEELLNKIRQGRRCFEELENMVLEDPSHENLQEIEANLDRLQSEGQNFLGDAINAGLN